MDARVAHAAVGVLEQFELSLAVFERALPRFFSGVGAAASASAGLVSPLAGDERRAAATGSAWLPADVRATLERWLADDLVLYAAARARLRARARELGLDVASFAVT